uniref:Cyclin-dependent kinase inhibitor domain-containing protein n=1 Tax=Sphaeramia orbicularis TaxID=375764 RepID=A0A673CC56_9TELE
HRNQQNPTGKGQSLRKQSVCRNLFGPVDHEQLRRDLRQKMKEMTERDSRRWNFNFHSDTPLPGSFEWEQIPADGGFALYRESTQMKEEEEEDRLQDCEEENQGGNQENCSSISNTPKGPAEATPVRRKRVHIKCARRSRDQDARIPDFFVKRRRTSETKSILSPFVQTSMEAALRKTIR